MAEKTNKVPSGAQNSRKHYDQFIMVFNVIGLVLKLVVILTYFINHFNGCLPDYPKMFSLY